MVRPCVRESAKQGLGLCPRETDSLAGKTQSHQIIRHTLITNKFPSFVRKERKDIEVEENREYDVT